MSEGERLPLENRSRVSRAAASRSSWAWRAAISAASARSKRAKKDANEWILGQFPAGGTNVFDPLASALEDGDVDTVWLLSDGDPTAGAFVFPDQILREVRRLNASRRVAIHTISVGQESDLLRRLAEENHGTHHVR